MLRNYFATMLRNLARNRLYAAINIIGLVVGFTAAMLIAAVHDERTFDAWLPGHENVYRLAKEFRPPGVAPLLTVSRTVSSSRPGCSWGRRPSRLLSQSPLSSVMRGWSPAPIPSRRSDTNRVR